MRILVVNDDGIDAPGLYALAVALKTVAEVTVVAPLKEMSGTGRAITLHEAIRRREVYKDGAFFGYGIGGTPVDCVKIALADIMKEKPDYVFSGINPGVNLSTHVFYSGTVSAASEGFDAGITSCAVSQSVPGFNKDCDFSRAAAAALKWLEYMETGRVPRGVLYNINLPQDGIKGFAFSRLDPRNLEMAYEKRVSPQGGTYYWVSGADVTGGAKHENSDGELLSRGYISVTPLGHSDRTDYGILEKFGNCEDLTL